MTSFIWWRSPEEAYENPYEYEAQEQFAREAEKIIQSIFEILMQKNRTFLRDDRSVDKAVWMLFVDGVETLRDCLRLINSKQHRIACRLFRDVVETMDLATYFSSSDEGKLNILAKWYDNEVVPNRVFRNYLSSTGADELGNAYRSIYSDLSRLNHRTYRSLAYSYIRNKDMYLVYEDENRDSEFLKLPHPIAMCYALLAEILTRFTDRLVECDIITSEQSVRIWNEALEKETVPRRYMSMRDLQIKRMYKQTQEDDHIT